MKHYLLFILTFFVQIELFGQKPPDTLQIIHSTPVHTQIICSFDYASSEIVITPCTYTGLVLVTVTNIDTGALALFTMASLSSGEERIPFYGVSGDYLAEIEILSGRGRRYYLMINL
ncbi:MAG: hypothetical protein IJU74_06750 [Bacteroidales bacterium]|nr:hypothetical protein [Bacteroidales bacterium]